MLVSVKVRANPKWPSNLNFTSTVFIVFNVAVNLAKTIQQKNVGKKIQQKKLFLIEENTEKFLKE